MATVEAASGELVVSLPATTSAFAAANIVARASGYIATRSVDIGDRVKAGDQLATIVAPELDHQISQAEATLAQLEAAAKQARANQKLASVTWRRDEPLVKEGWIPKQQGTIDVQTLRANEAAVSVAEANVVAQQAALQVLQQQKAYQSVVAPFDGVITQRNIDIGSLVQADAVNSTFMFTILQSNVIRTQVYVPQDAATGVVPGIDAVIRVPELPDHPFPGKVTRIADALQPGTRTLLVEIDIANPDGALSPGIYATAELHIPRKTPSLIGAGGRHHLQQGRRAGGRRRGRRGAPAQDHDRARPRHRGRGARRRQGRRPRDPQSRRRARRRRSRRDPHMTLDSFFSSRRELSPHGSRLRAGRRSPASPAARRPLFKTGFSSGVNFPPWFTPVRRAALPCLPRRPAPSSRLRR